MQLPLTVVFCTAASVGDGTTRTCTAPPTLAWTLPAASRTCTATVICRASAHTSGVPTTPMMLVAARSDAVTVACCRSRHPTDAVSVPLLPGPLFTRKVTFCVAVVVVAIVPVLKPLPVTVKEMPTLCVP